MQAQAYFYDLLLTSPNTLLKNDILHSGKFLSPQVRQSLKTYKNITTETKLKNITKDPSEQSLGPGRYYTPTPPIVPAFKFSTTPRFRLENDSPISVSMSSGYLSSKSPLPSIQRSFVSISSRKKKIKKNYEIEMMIKKQTKELICSQRKEFILKSIKEKEQKAEYRKNAKVKDAVCKYFTTLVVSVLTTRVYYKRFYDMKRYKGKIIKLLEFLRIISRALGKFRLNGKRQKIKSAWKSLKILFPYYIRNWKKKRISYFNEIINGFFSIFTKRKTFTLYFYLLKTKIALIQKNIRNFVACSLARRKGLEIMWNNLNKKKIQIPNEVRDYFISKHIRENLMNQYYAVNKDKKIMMLLNENKHEEYLDEMMCINHKILPLKIFSKKDVLGLISSAYACRATWGKFNNKEMTSSQVMINGFKPIKKLQKKRFISKKKKNLLVANQFSSKAFSLISKKPKLIDNSK
ncbi:hypothetical protein SteCoe_3168 [Stentor coeruleus]|uniref:Uncharacterized protein n=1 Tax=Stentor coeruleus TaxID=5963 RepID=A0A1R2CY09_9CILI|nr:hypothetical protein SteCoe_3168 [Stentor coeruleus]